MTRLFEEATSQGISELTSDVSRTAQPIYEKFGITIVEQRLSMVRGVVSPNALVKCRVA
jgi:putative acetyltransferase